MAVFNFFGAFLLFFVKKTMRAPILESSLVLSAVFPHPRQPSGLFSILSRRDLSAHHEILLITPQPSFLPAFPEGWEWKSSLPLWITTVLPTTSSGRKRPVSNTSIARPPRDKRGGMSPAWFGCGASSGLKCPPVLSYPSPAHWLPSWI